MLCGLPQSGKLSVLFLLKRPKISIFAPHGRLVAPIHVKFGRTEGHMGPLGHAQFHRGEHVDRFLQKMRPTTLCKCFNFHMIRFTGYGVIAEKPFVFYPEIFRALCRKNYVLDRKMFATFLMVLTSFITMQSLGEDLTTRAGCRCENVVFFSVTLRPGGLCVRGVHNSNDHCVAVYGSSLMRFSTFFQKGSPFQKQYTILMFVARWCHSIREIAVKNY